MSDTLAPINAKELLILSQVTKAVSYLQGALNQATNTVQLLDPYAVLTNEDLCQADNTFLEHFADNIPEQYVWSVVYMESIPTIEGYPLWERLPSEPVDYFNLFKQYRAYSHENGGKRSLYQLQILTQIPMSQLRTLSTLFHWTMRANAFDAFEELQYMERRQWLQRQVDTEQYKAADNLFNLGVKYVRDHADTLNPKLAVQLIEVAAKMQRLSVGLSSGGGSGSALPTVNITNTNTTSATPEEVKSVISGTTDKDKERLTQLLNIMNNIGVLQEESSVVADVEATEATDF